MRCPLCDTELPPGATSCTRCDWVRDPDLPPLDRGDWIAAAMSVVPGLGHVYKGHLLPGVLVLCVIGPIYLALVLILVPGTLGVSLILPAIFVAFVAVHAFNIRNARRDPGPLEQARRTLAEWTGRAARDDRRG